MFETTFLSCQAFIYSGCSLVTKSLTPPLLKGVELLNGTYMLKLGNFSSWISYIYSQCNVENYFYLLEISDNAGLLYFSLKWMGLIFPFDVYKGLNKIVTHNDFAEIFFFFVLKMYFG